MESPRGLTGRWQPRDPEQGSVGIPLGSAPVTVKDQMCWWIRALGASWNACTGTSGTGCGRPYSLRRGSGGGERRRGRGIRAGAEARGRNPIPGALAVAHDLPHRRRGADLLPTAIGHGRSREAARGATKLLVVLWWQQSGVPSASASDSWSGSWRQEVTTSPRAAGPHFHPSWVVAAGAHVWLLTIPRNDKSPMAAPENDWFQLPALRGSQPPLDSATDACRALRRWTAQHSQSA